MEGTERLYALAKLWKAQAAKLREATGEEGAPDVLEACARELSNKLREM